LNRRLDEFQNRSGRGGEKNSCFCRESKSDHKVRRLDTKLTRYNVVVVAAAVVVVVVVVVVVAAAAAAAAAVTIYIPIGSSQCALKG
jgi:hypothetical protein